MLGRRPWHDGATPAQSRMRTCSPALAEVAARACCLHSALVEQELSSRGGRKGPQAEYRALEWSSRAGEPARGQAQQGALGWPTPPSSPPLYPHLPTPGPHPRPPTCQTWRPRSACRPSLRCAPLALAPPPAAVSCVLGGGAGVQMHAVRGAGWRGVGRDRGVMAGPTPPTQLSHPHPHTLARAGARPARARCGSV